MLFRLLLLVQALTMTTIYPADIFWSGAIDNDFLESLNWSSKMLPSTADSAILSAEATSFSPSLRGAPKSDIVFQAIKFVDNTPFNFTLKLSVSRQLILDQEGVVNLGHLDQNFAVNGSSSILRFANQSSADSTGSNKIFYHIANSGRIRFVNNATASNAHINLSESGGLLEFFSNSSADKAQIVLSGNRATVTFFNHSKGGSAYLTSANNGNIVFANTAQAQSAQLDISKTTLTFENNSQANNAIITAKSTSIVTFQGSSSANSCLINAENSKVTFNNTAKGNSARINLNASQLTLNQNNTLGSLNTDANSVVSLNAFHLAIGHLNQDMVIEGTIHGFGGSLTKLGNGALSLNGESTYTGNTLIQSGKLLGNGKIGNDLTIAPGAIFSPGNNTIGTFTIGGNYNQSRESILQIPLNGNGQSSLVQAEGIASLSGELQAFSIDGTYAIGKEYVVVNSNLGILNSFQNVKLNNAYFLPAIHYTNNKAFLSLTPNFAGSAFTCNEAKIAAQIDTLTQPSETQLDLINHLAQETIDDLRMSLSKMSGEQYISFLYLDEKNNNHFLRRIDALVPFFYKECFDDYEPAAYGCNSWLNLGGGKGCFSTPYKTYYNSEWDVSGGASKFVSDEWVVGFAGNYINSQLKYRLGGQGKLQQGKFALYSFYVLPSYYLSFNAIGGLGKCKLQRKLGISGISHAKSHFTLADGTLYGEIGQNIYFLDMGIQPFLGLQFTHLHRSTAKERRASLLNLKATNRGYSLLASRLGVHLYQPFRHGIGLQGELVWRHNNYRNARSMKIRFLNFGRSFNLKIQPLSTNAFEYVLNLSKKFNEQIYGFLECSGEYSTKHRSYEISAGIHAQF
ncbi:Uncharacterized protein PHSC3_000440 [Chlamydiales bacterium STE3]|nr:Uncharacterized protein PHSC3_000440 [Chlamydiales bacterium STE3]